jgi:hypothetical protein
MEEAGPENAVDTVCISCLCVVQCVHAARNQKSKIEFKENYELRLDIHFDIQNLNFLNFCLPCRCTSLQEISCRIS